MPGEKGVHPTTFAGKFKFYGQRYGYLSACSRFIGRKSAWYWRIAGRASTVGHLERWRKRSGCKIVNLGGGGNLSSDWLTVDVDARADAFVDIIRPLPFDGNEIDAVYCEEVIEHMSLEHARTMLKEVLRVLRPGGDFRVTTPDLAHFCRRLLNSPRQTDEINAMFFGHGHKHLFTNEELFAELDNAGFCNLRLSEYRDERFTLGRFDSHADRFSHPPEWSLYINCQKP
jgi:predicted SAM-dependent methyltransferase